MKRLFRSLSNETQLAARDVKRRFIVIATVGAVLPPALGVVSEGGRGAQGAADQAIGTWAWAMWACSTGRDRSPFSTAAVRRVMAISSSARWIGVIARNGGSLK